MKPIYQNENRFQEEINITKPESIANKEALSYQEKQQVSIKLSS